MLHETAETAAASPGWSEWPGPLRMSWTRVAAASESRRAHFKRPLPDVLPGLFTGQYDGIRIPLHTHEALLVVLPVTRFIVQAGGIEVPAGPGDICLSNMLELHGAVAGAIRCQARILLVSPGLLREIAETQGTTEGTEPRFGRMPLADPVLAQAFSALWDELERPVKSSQIAGWCRSLLQELVRHRGAVRDPSVSDKRTHLAIGRVQEHLQRNVVESQALEELAAVARVSKSYLVREFHRLVGLPPHAYHIQLRIARAARLLAAGMSLSRAASEAGFADQSHLSRRFKTAYGVTPLGFAHSVRPAPNRARSRSSDPYRITGAGVVSLRTAM
jgi:AraC-like DNA-binding protein